MKPAAKKSLLAVATMVLVIVAAMILFTGQHDPEALVKAAALATVAERTHTPESSWVIRECSYDGKTWTVCATAVELKGRVLMTLSPSGEILTYGPAPPQSD